MEYPLEALLDACVTELKKGADLEEVLGEYPDAADELRPLLAAAAWAALNVPPLRNAQLHKRELMALAEKRRRLVESVDGYVNEVRAGVPYGDIVSRAPDAMAPVLLAAWRMKATNAPPRDPAKVAAGKERVMALAAERRRPVRTPVSLPRRLPSGIADALAAARPRPGYVRRIRTVAASGVTAGALFVSLISVNTAAAGSVPGEPFYGVKRLGEAAQLQLATSAADRAALNLAFSERRLSEMRLLTESGRRVPGALADDWLRGHYLAWQDASRLPADQRAHITQLILASLEVGPLGVGSRTELVAESGSLARSLRRSLDRAAVVPVDAPLVSVSGGPSVGPRPLPVEDTAPPGVSEPEPIAAEVPAVQPVEAPAPVEMVAPVVSAPGGDEDDEADVGGGTAAPVPEVPVDVPEPPAFGAPPVAPSPDEPGTGEPVTP